MIRRVGIACSTTLVGTALSLAAALPVSAQPSDPPISGDPRATAHAGNATTCSQAGLTGSKVTVEFVIDPTNRFVTITSVPSNIELTGTVVKGGPAYNVYSGEHRTLLHSPLVGGDNQNIPEISHWFACGIKKDTSTTTTTTTTTTTESSATTTPPGGGTTTTTPAGQGSAGAADGDLAATGVSSVTPLLVAGSALVLIGGGLLFLLRRTRGQRR